VLILLCVAQFMVTLDITVVNVALPSIGRAFSFAPGELSWVVTAYLLCTGGLVLLGGRAADLLGSRRMLVVGLGVFTAASLASGLAPNATALIVARAAQGVGATLLSPSALSIITRTYTGPRRAKALSVWGAIAAGGFAGGLLIGGILTTWLSWGWIFFINVPVGVAALALVPRLVASDQSAPRLRGRIGARASLTLTAGLVAIVYGVSTSASYGWASISTLVSLGLGGMLLATFALGERTGASPLLPAVIWRNRPLVTSSVVMFGATGVLAGTLFVSTFFVQQELHASPLTTGLYYLPFAAIIGVVTQFGPRLLARFGSRVVAVAALLAVAGGTLLLAAAPGHAQYATDLLPAFVVLGAGIGLTFVTVSVTSMVDIAADQAGAASGLVLTGHEVGGAIGVAVLSTVATTAGGAAAGLGIAQGHAVAFTVAAGIAAGVALLAAVAMPAVRPPSEAITSSDPAQDSSSTETHCELVAQ
jgi:EmrB/QacA subfamily drug resistance transporter